MLMTYPAMGIMNILFFYYIGQDIIAGANEVFEEERKSIARSGSLGLIKTEDDQEAEKKIHSNAAIFKRHTRGKNAY